jgi:hypothetical protein
MRNVSNLVPVADADEVGKIVLNDAEVIAMVGDVGGKQQRVTTRARRP